MLASRAFGLLALGISDRFASARAGGLYDAVRDYASTVVFLCMGIAIVRRLFFLPARYAHRSADAIFLLALIAVLMAADGVFEGSKAAFHAGRDSAAEFFPPLSLPWIFQAAFASASLAPLAHLHLGAYLAHEITFFFLLCYRPFGIQFHVETSLFSIYFAKLDRGTVKPVRWGIPDEQLDTVPSFGVKKIRGLYLETHPGLLLLRGLRPVRGPVPGERGRKTAFPAGALGQDERLRFPPLPGLGPVP